MEQALRGTADPEPAGQQYWAEEGEEQYEDPLQIFNLIHPLGRGSYGSVYKARVYETGELVAVKIIPLTEQDEIGSIQREVALLRECNHPNIVKYYGSWRTPDALWIAMEYCAGGSVSDIMHACDSALEEDLISYVCSETLAGLAYLHGIGKLHRDIKCGNILLGEGGEVKLADFGVAAQLTNTMSKRNTFIGTPHWMAPEVIQASHYDGKVDVWALGVTAIEMAERWPPRWKVNPNRVIFQIVKDPPPRLGDKERWSLVFQDFVAQCLQKEARMRPTAKYLQQHKFVARDRAAAVRALAPMVAQARAFSAELAAAAAAARAPSPSNEAVYVDWRETLDARGTVQAYGAGSTVAARAPHHAQQAQQQQAPRAYQETLPAAAVNHLRDPGASPAASGAGAALGPGSAAAAAGGSDQAASGTFVVREAPGAGRLPAGYGTVQSSAAVGREQEDYDGGTFVMHGSPLRPQAAGTVAAAAAPAAAAGGGPPSSDYLAAVQAVAEGQAAELDVAFMPPPTRAVLLLPPSQKAPQSEAKRVIEKLHSLYSSGAVVPLPFLRATDAAPLALLGLERGPPNMPGVQQAGPQWESALAGVLAEAAGGADGDHHILPPLVQQQVQASPVLLNLATTLAHHRQLLDQAQAEGGWGEGAQSRVRAQLASKAEDLADTLRTILCL